MPFDQLAPKAHNEIEWIGVLAKHIAGLERKKPKK
jgi:hypothetical protein